VVSNLVPVAFTFFHEEGFGGETFLFFEGSSSSLGGVDLPFFGSTSSPSISPPSPHFSAKMEVFLMDVLSQSWTSSVFFILLGLGISVVVSGLSTLDICIGFAGTRSSTDHSLVISLSHPLSTCSMTATIVYAH
jgi:hypothetical protein